MNMLPLVGIVVSAISSPPSDSSPLPRSAPEVQGVSSLQVLEFVKAANDTIDSMNSFMLLRHGHVIAEGWWAPYRAEAPNTLFSLSKSFTSTAVGLAIAEGKLSLDDEVLKFFPEDAPANPSNNLKAMRISDLLRMSTGQQSEPPRTDQAPWTKTFLSHPIPIKPGTHFQYNTSATYMLSAIVQKATGQTLLEYLTPRLFEPIGIEHPTWQTSPQGISTGGYGLSIRTEDIARFGQLYLQRGLWNGKQIIPESWVSAATSLQTSNGSNPRSDWDQGYGYQFWRCRNGAYRGDGAFGQYCIVLPDHDAVIVITSGVKDMQAVLNLVWDKLLPAFGEGGHAAKPNPEAATKLSQYLSELSLATVKGTTQAPSALNKRYTFPSNSRKIEMLSFEKSTDEKTSTLLLRIDGDERALACGNGYWHEGRLAWTSPEPQPVAVTGAWTSDDTYVAKICFYETPFIVTLTCKATGEELKFDTEANVGFGPTKQPTLVGTSNASKD